MQKIPLAGDNQRTPHAPLPTATFGPGRYAGAPLFVPARGGDIQRGVEDGDQDGDRGEVGGGVGAGVGAEVGREDEGYVFTFVYD